MPYGEKASSSSSSSISLLLSPSLIYFNLSCFTFPLREHACWWAAPYRPRNCVCALAVMKHLDAGESDGCALIQVVVLPMQAPAPSCRLSLPLQTAWWWEMSRLTQVFFFLWRGQGFSSGAWWLRVFVDIWWGDNGSIEWRSRKHVKTWWCCQ